MSTRRRLAWPLALAAMALLGCVALLVRASVEQVPGAGWEERVTPGESCDGTPSATFVREPFVRQEDESPARCVEWSAVFVARSKMRAHLEMVLEGEGSVTIDGRSVVSDDPSRAAAREDGTAHRVTSGFADLSPGVHSFLTSFRVRSSQRAYFRLAMEDELDPHDDEVVAPLDDDAFFSSPGDAARSLGSAPRARSLWGALMAALALAGAGVLAWLAIRAHRGLAVPRVDLLLGAAIFAAALFLRVHALDLQDRSWDELSYVNSGLHYVRNVVLGDYCADAWRHICAHPPNTKWILGVGALLGGLDGARAFGGVMGSLAVAFVFAFGRVAFGRGVGALAGALAACLPVMVAHGRVAGHESMVLFWWCASMLAFACWSESREEMTGPSSGRGDPLAAFICGFAAVAGVFSRATAIWGFPVLAGGWIANSHGTIRQRLRAFPPAALVGSAAAAALVFAMFPFMWSGQAEKIRRIAALWSRPWGDIEVYMGKLCLPAAHYFLVAFLSETPALLLVAAAAGVVLLLRRGPKRRWGIFCLLWLVVPFLQSVSTLRIGAGRYVIQSWPALLLFAAVALVALGKELGALTFQLSKSGRALLAAAPGVLAVFYTCVALERVEPYPLDYFNELVGGPSGVAARRMFEIPWWGEGNRAAVTWLNAVAKRGARVRLALWPKHSIERLRDDLIQVDDPALADYVVLSHLQYFEQAPAGCTLVRGVQVAGAPLVNTYLCTPASPTQLGFAEMHDPARVDQAIAHFQDALKLDPGDPGAIFGLGWAAQVKGDLRQAEMRYIAASLRAVQVHDAETEYFARYDLGTLYRQEGKTAQAIDAFRSALALRPNEASIVEALRALVPPPDAGRD